MPLLQQSQGSNFQYRPTLIQVNKGLLQSAYHMIHHGVIAQVDEG